MTQPVVTPQSAARAMAFTIEFIAHTPRVPLSRAATASLIRPSLASLVDAPAHAHVALRLGLGSEGLVAPMAQTKKPRPREARLVARYQSSMAARDVPRRGLPLFASCAARFPPLAAWAVFYVLFGAASRCSAITTAGWIAAVYRVVLAPPERCWPDATAGARRRRRQLHASLACPRRANCGRFARPSARLALTDTRRAGH